MSADADAEQSLDDFDPTLKKKTKKKVALDLDLDGDGDGDAGDVADGVDKLTLDADDGEFGQKKK